MTGHKEVKNQKWSIRLSKATCPYSNNGNYHMHEVSTKSGRDSRKCLCNAKEVSGAKRQCLLVQKTENQVTGFQIPDVKVVRKIIVRVLDFPADTDNKIVDHCLRLVCMYMLSPCPHHLHFRTGLAHSLQEKEDNFQEDTQIAGNRT